jgi:MFS family permease
VQLCGCTQLGARFLVSVDFSILNVALPQVGASMVGVTGLPWITSAYALPAAGCTLLFGRLADLFGRRRLFLSAMVPLASLLGGFAVNPEMLLSTRSCRGWPPR